MQWVCYIMSTQLEYRCIGGLDTGVIDVELSCLKIISLYMITAWYEVCFFTVRQETKSFSLSYILTMT